MAARQPTLTRKASGENIDNWQRKTVAILLRMQPEDAELLRGRSETTGIPLAAYVGRLVRQDAKQALADERAEGRPMREQ